MAGIKEIFRHFSIRLSPFVLLLVIGTLLVKYYSSHGVQFSNVALMSSDTHRNKEETRIIVVTPTYRRSARMADMTRLSQTLSQVKNLHWIVVEDANSTSFIVERILQRSGVPYVYFPATSDKGMPRKGWTHRNHALQYILENYKANKNGVVYFADDDNAYDLRLFNNYIRKVKRLGIWAVGLSGGATVEAPRVVNGKIVAWDVVWAPGRAFGVDMAGFAVNLKEIFRVPKASFGRKCIGRAPETCFIEQFGIKKEDAEPFGFDENPKEVLAWHTRTGNPRTRGSNHGYIVEY